MYGKGEGVEGMWIRKNLEKFSGGGGGGWVCGLQVKIVSVHVLYFSFFGLSQSGYVSLRQRDETWGSTIMSLYSLEAKLHPAI